MRKKKLIFLIVAILFLSEIVLATGEVDYGSEAFQEIASQLYMQGHADHDISTCATKATVYKEIAEMIQQGNTKDQIISYYVEQYGEAALKAPGTKGFSLMAWVVPFAVLGVAAIVIFLFIRSWVLKMKKQSESLTKQVFAVPQPLQESIRVKIDEERKKYQ